MRIHAFSEETRISHHPTSSRRFAGLLSNTSLSHKLIVVISKKTCHYYLDIRKKQILLYITMKSKRDMLGESSEAVEFNAKALRKLQRALKANPEADLLSLLPTEYSERLRKKQSKYYNLVI